MASFALRSRNGCRARAACTGSAARLRAQGLRGRRSAHGEHDRRVMLEHVPTSPDDRRAGSEEAIAVLAPDAGLVPELTPVQLLAPDGSCVSHERYRRCASNEELLRMYESMVVTRRLDQEFINLQRQG